jgi:hypothetical protein
VAYPNLAPENSALAAGMVCKVQTHIISVHADRQTKHVVSPLAPVVLYEYFVHNPAHHSTKVAKWALTQHIALFIQPAEINAIMRKIKELIPRRRRAQVIFNLLAQTACGLNITALLAIFVIHIACTI